MRPTRPAQSAARVLGAPAGSGACGRWAAIQPSGVVPCASAAACSAAYHASGISSNGVDVAGLLGATELAGLRTETVDPRTPMPHHHLGLVGAGPRTIPAESDT